MNRLLGYFINKGLFVNLLTLIILISGWVAWRGLRREAFPNISFDVVVVSTPYLGAAPEQVEQHITTPIEREIKEVDGIDEYSSVSLEGLSLVVIQLDLNSAQKDRVVNDIQRAVDRVDDFPEDLEDKPIVRDIQTKNQPLMELAMSGEVPEEQLRELADDLADKLETIPGVAKIIKKGYREQEIWVEARPEDLSAYHLGLEDIMVALAGENVNVPSGTIKMPGREIILRTSGEFKTPAEVERVIIRANDQGHWLQVKDVAAARLSYADETEINKAMGRRAINLVVIKKASGDALKVGAAVKDSKEKFAASAPASLQIHIVNDMTYFIQRRLRIINNNAIFGMIFVTVMLFIFLSPRLALWTAAGIPFALMTTFLVMQVMGLTINLIAMLGMMVVLGMLVDDAIVIAENTYRHLEEGKPLKEAALIGVQEVWLPVTSTVLTTIAAFTPLLFMSGIFGKFVFNIPLVVIIALAASLLEAFFILPAHLAAYGLAKKNRGTLPARMARQERWFERFAQGYQRLLGRLLAWRYHLMGGAITLCLVAYFLGTKIIPFQLFTNKGIEIFFIRAKATIGTSLEDMSHLISPIEQAISALPREELDSFITTVGKVQNDPNDPFTVRGSHVAQTTVFLTPASNSRRAAEEIIHALRLKLQHTPGLTEVSFEGVKPGPPVGKPIAIRLRGDDFNTLKMLAEKTKEALKSVPGATDIKDDLEEGKQQFSIIIDRQKAMQAKLMVSDVARTIRNAFEGGVSTTIRMGEEDIDVRVRLEEEARRDPATLAKIVIPNPAGNLVPLAAIARWEENPGTSQIKHFDGKRIAMVSAQVQETTTSMAVNRQARKLLDPIVASHPEITVHYGGEAEDTDESLRSFYQALLIAVLLVFMILASNFNSLTQPLLIILTIPLGMMGVVFTFLLHAKTISFLALIGIVGLAGVVVNDAIIIVDFINSKRRQHASVREAILAGSKLRLRPVILTTITTMGGILPVAYGIGGADPFLKPMALAIGWGLGWATLLTLVLIPCAYAILEDIKNLRRKLALWLLPASAVTLTLYCWGVIEGLNLLQTPFRNFLQSMGFHFSG